jgi:hypothetical protein
MSAHWSSVELTGDELYALCELLARVTPRQLRRVGLDRRDLEALESAHTTFVDALAGAVPFAVPDPRQLELLPPARRGEAFVTQTPDDVQNPGPLGPARVDTRFCQE